jgi:hypothetical protein
MGITTDNAANNNRFISLLAGEMDDHNIFFDDTERHIRCFAHIINLSIQKALKKLDEIIKQVYIVIIFIFLYINYL